MNALVCLTLNAKWIKINRLNKEEKIDSNMEERCEWAFEVDLKRALIKILSIVFKELSNQNGRLGINA